MKSGNINLKLKVLEVITKEAESTNKKSKINSENRKKALLESLPADGEECIYDLIIY